jgi:hypothetical protein
MSDGGGAADRGTGSKRPDVLSLALDLAGYADGDYLTKAGMRRVFRCAGRSIQRMVDRFEIPPPASVGGRNIWNVGRLKAWIADMARRRETEAAREAKRMKAFTL